MFRAAPLFEREFETQRLVDLVDRVLEHGGAVVVRGEAATDVPTLLVVEDGEPRGELYLKTDRFAAVFAADLPERVTSVAAVTQRPVAARGRRVARDRAVAAVRRRRADPYRRHRHPRAQGDRRLMSMNASIPGPARSTSAQEPFWFLGGRIRIFVPSAATGGALSVMEFDDVAGHAPPLSAAPRRGVQRELDPEESMLLRD